MIKIKRIGPNKWQLLEDWQSPFMLIPKGFITDGASVPRFFWWFASPTGDLFEASIVHDYMYENAIQTKQKADQMFKRVATHYKANKLRVILSYVMVKCFGKGRY